MQLTPHRTQSGITLIELMVVVVIVAILAAIAYPSYRQQVLRSKRTDAKTALTRVAQELENCFTRYFAYDSDACPVKAALQGAGISSNDGNYLVTAAGGDLAALKFKLTATPQGGQAADVGCGNLTLAQDDTRGVSGSKGAVECWK